MTSRQGYISKELTHFVGRKEPNDESRYKLLLDILTSGCLTASPHDSEAGRHMMVMPGARISNNEMYQPQCVCFCDIPVRDLTIHMGKYSRFGIAFLKSFLALKGANPVFYIANKSSVRHPSFTRAEYFDENMKVYHEFVKALLYRRDPLIVRKDPWILELHRWFVRLRSFLEWEIFSYVKGFDNTLPEEHADNYYMEREWRIIGELEFELNDVCRVVLPGEFAERFRHDLSTYTGKVKFLD